MRFSALPPCYPWQMAADGRAVLRTLQFVLGIAPTLSDARFATLTANGKVQTIEFAFAWPS